MTNIIQRIKYQWWYFKIVILGMKPDCFRISVDESSPPPCRTLFVGDLLFDKETETVWVADCNSYLQSTDDGGWTEEVIAYRLNDDLDFRFFLSDQVIKMN